ncbi:hypothetical protein ACIGXA_24560 [Streptomyces fildesensis]|uniref:Secreted protein n=1 Tax=Streptomyces fildesensis TaxID=375757 RepID=A0ABW8CB89_9ACTN
MTLISRPSRAMTVLVAAAALCATTATTAHAAPRRTPAAEDQMTTPLDFDRNHCRITSDEDHYSLATVQRTD